MISDKGITHFWGVVYRLLKLVALLPQKLREVIMRCDSFRVIRSAAG
jgi:hypothetical protein